MDRHNDPDYEGEHQQNMNVVKPVAALSHTDWLTDAIDAEPGMELVIATGIDTERFPIKSVDSDPYRIRLEDGSSVPIQKVNASRTMVIE